MTKEEIKQERQKRYWTQNELAKKAGVLSSQVCEWEKGRYNPSLRSQKKIKEVFEANPV